MASCQLCGMDGLTWSENPNPRTGRHYLINTNINNVHVCTEKMYCHQCKIVLSSYDAGKRHILTKDYHVVTPWRTTDDQSKQNALVMGVPPQLVNRNN